MVVTVVRPMYVQIEYEKPRHRIRWSEATQKRELRGKLHTVGRYITVEDISQGRPITSSNFFWAK